MIAAALIVFLVCLALLGWPLPRFIGRCASALWERKVRRQQERQMLQMADRAREVSRQQATLRPMFLPRRTLEDIRDLHDETGAAVPSTVTVLTFVAGMYLLVLAVRAILSAL